MEISSKVELAEVKVGDTLWPLKWIESHATVSKREADTVSSLPSLYLALLLLMRMPGSC